MSFFSRLSVIISVVKSLSKNFFQPKKKKKDDDIREKFFPHGPPCTRFCFSTFFFWGGGELPKSHLPPLKNRWSPLIFNGELRECQSFGAYILIAPALVVYLVCLPAKWRTLFHLCLIKSLISLNKSRTKSPSLDKDQFTKSLHS